MALTVNEFFFSIQGESLAAGRPCVFVRLTGCNLRCTYCDTRYADEAGVRRTIEDIISRVEAYRFPLVEITGGEPLLQEETPLLAQRLLERGMEVMLETNGTLPIDRVPDACARIVDIKCPGSGHSQDFDPLNIDRLGPRDQLKFVISDRRDYEFALEMTDQLRNRAIFSPILLSPVSGMLDPRLLAKWILADRRDVRLQLQLHKILWPLVKRGV